MSAGLKEAITACTFVFIVLNVLVGNVLLWMLLAKHLGV